MLDLKNIILIFIILFLLNQVKFNKSNKIISNSTKLYSTNSKNVEKMSPTSKILNKDLLYGKDQFNIIQIPDKKYKYQNMEVLNKNNNLELTSNLKFSYDKNNSAHVNTINLNVNHFDSKNLSDKLFDIDYKNYPLTKEQIIINYNNENNKGIVGTSIYNVEYPKGYASENLNKEKPIEQKMLYDYRFLDTIKDDLTDVKENTNFDGKNIKEVYDDLVLDYKKINQQKKPIVKKSVKIDGAFGEAALDIDQWYYENDKFYYENDINSKLSYDPNQGLELAVHYEENDF